MRTRHEHQGGKGQATEALWLRMEAPGRDYLEPGYYSRILKPYVFSGRSDLAILDDYLNGVSPAPRSVLEIGPGCGRATQVILRKFPAARFSGVDLSARMIHASAERFSAERDRTRWVVQDAISYLNDGVDQFDLIVSLWSISHAIHQSIARLGSDEEAATAIAKLFAQRVAKHGRVFIMHFDSTSDEQLLSLSQRRRIWPFLQPGESSPSQRLFQKALDHLDHAGGWSVRVDRLSGDAIEYHSMDEALESYMNFHMEGWFNQRPERDLVVGELKAGLSRHRGSDGVIRVVPGCVLFVAERV